MSIQKKQNSVLVLATLGVYLGLVLVGATPQVLAQAAMTRQFNIKDEIEVNDDLDKRPDPNIDELVSMFDTHFTNVKHFVDDLRKLYSIEKWDLDWDTFDSQKSAHQPCPPTGIGLSSNTSSHIDRWLIPAIEQAQFNTDDWLSMADCLPFTDTAQPNWKVAKTSGIRLSYDKDDLTYTISVERGAGRGDSLYSALLRALEVFQVDEDDGVSKVLLQHTSLTKSGNQVFIVTRLPRAGLDALLASNAK